MRALALLLLTGCSAPGVVHVYLRDDTYDPIAAQLLVQEAVEDYYGLDVQWSAERYGALRLELIPTQDSARYHGRASTTQGCLRTAWANTRATSIAHEVGHMLGLAHVQDKGNLMYPEGGEDLTPRQLDRAWDSAALLEACRL